MNCEYDDDQWSAGFLLRVAVRLQYIWATYGIRDGERTIKGPQPAVCFSNFSLADLIAVRDGLSPQNEAATGYALTLPIKVAEKGGILPFIVGPNGRVNTESETSLELKEHQDIQNQPRSADAGHNLSVELKGGTEWRWYYPGDYRRCIDKIEMDGIGHTLPGLKLCSKKWSGIGVVVPDRAAACQLQYDILSLIDRGVVSDTHFDHILVCDQLPASIEGLAKEDIQAAFTRACFDFKSCLRVSTLLANVSELDFSSRVLILEASAPRKPVMEQGGCWLWFADNTHIYLRGLLKAGRVKVNKQGRYLASLDELDPRRDLRQRQEMAAEVSRQLQEKFGIQSSYFSVLNSGSPNGIPSFSGSLWKGGYFIREEPEED
jgi:hypothetical protein